MAKYKLFYSPAACSLAVHAVLNAVGADFELIETKITDGANYSPDYLKYNAIGQIPVLVEDEMVLKESAAIMIHLLDKAKSPLLPQDNEERIKAMQWLLFFNSSMHQTYSAYFLILRNLQGAGAEEAKTLITKRIKKLWRYVEGEITSEFIAGSHPTAADILMTVIANWLPHITPGVKVQNICKKITEQPYFAKSLATEGIKYRGF